METVDPHIFSANNTYILLGVSVGLLIGFTTLLIAFKLFSSVQHKVLLLVLPILFLLLLFPVFSMYNLTHWISHIGIAQVFEAVASYESIIAIPLNLLKWALIGIFLKYVSVNGKLSSKEQVLIFIPIVNVYFITKALFANGINTGKSASFILILSSCVFSFYTFIFPLLLLLDIDAYGWYLNFIYGEPQIPNGGLTEAGYIYWNDLILHSQVTISFFCGALTLPFFYRGYKLYTKPGRIPTQ